MTWTTPMTFVAATTLTAAQLNTHLRDNLNETAVAKATTAGRWFVSTGSNAIAERAISDNQVATAETTASTSYIALTTAGPAVTVTTGTSALAIFRCFLFNNGAGNSGFMSVAVSGATTVASSDNWAVAYESTAASDGVGIAVTHRFTGLTPGSNVFTAQYRVTAGTGTFQWRDLIVLGQ